MKKLRLTTILLGLSLATGNLMADGDGPPIFCGGGGPGPMLDITPMLSAVPVTALDVKQGVEEFVYLEGRNTVVYRNASHRLYENVLAENKSRLLSERAAPLSRVVDPTERYLTSLDGRSLFDGERNAWTPIPGTIGPAEPLFWWRSAIQLSPRFFFLGSGYTADGQTQSFHLYSYLPGEPSAYSCSFTMPANYRRVKGATAPYVTFYTEQPTEQGRLVTFTYVTPGCRKRVFHRRVHLLVPMAHALEEVYQFNGRGTAFRFRHPKKSLVWLSAKGEDTSLDQCQVYDTHNRTPIFLNNTVPIVATTGEKGGVSLFFLDKKQQGRLIPDLSLAHLDSRYLWLSRDGRKLFLSPDPPAGETSRPLFQVDLPQ